MIGIFKVALVLLPLLTVSRDLNKDPLRILLWMDHEEWAGWQSGTLKTSNNNTCLMTRNREVLDKADVVYFMWYSIRQHPLLPRPDHQIWAVATMESLCRLHDYTYHQEMVEALIGSFNIFQSYMRSSTVHTPYGKYIPLPRTLSHIPDSISITRSKG